MIFGIRIDITEEMIRIEQRGVILVGPLVVLRVVDSFKVRRGAVAVPDMAAHKMDNDKVIFVFGKLLYKIEQLIIVAQRKRCPLFRITVLRDEIDGTVFTAHFALVAHPPCFIAGKVCHIYDIGYVIYIPVVILVSPVKEHGKRGNSDGKAGICFIHEVKIRRFFHF